jgi:hypothetical protein
VSTLFRSLHARLLMASILAAMALIVGSCVIPAQEALKNQSDPPQNAENVQQSNAAGGQGLIKPSIPPEAPLRARDTGQESPPPKPIRVVIDNKKEPSAPRRDWEDQKVKIAADALIKSSPNVKKMRICYAVKYDEWWVTLYEDMGPLFDLKQFVWNREQERLQPHLVEQRISKSALERHLKESDPDQACEIIDPPQPSKAETQPGNVPPGTHGLPSGPRSETPPPSPR